MKKMMILLIGILISIVSASSAVALYDVQLSSVRFHGIYEGDMEVYYNVFNIGQHDIEDASITIWIPETGDYFISHSFDVGDGEKHGQVFLADVTDIEPGEYFARIKVTSDYAEDSTWRWIVVE